MVPRGWKRIELSELVVFKSGGTPSKQIGKYWGGEIPWLTAKDLKSFKLSDSVIKLTKEGMIAAQKIVPANTILMLVRGMTLLKDLPIGVTTRDVTFNQDIKALVPKNGVDAYFLAYALVDNKERIRQNVTLAGHGTGRLEMDFLERVPLLIPPLSIQQKISGVLGELDQILSGFDRLVCAKVELKKGLMQQLLAPIFCSNKQKVNAFRKFRLGDLFDERIETNHNNLVLLSITADRGVVPRDELNRKDSSSEDKSKYKRIAPGDIGYNTMRMWQGVSALSKLEGIVSPAYTVCTPNDLIDGLFASYLFKYSPVVHLLHRHSQGMVDDTLSLKFPNFAQIKVVIPPIAEQKRIAAILSTLDREIELLKKSADLFKQQKKGLMQKLLTGEVRVKAAVAEMEATS